MKASMSFLNRLRRSEPVVAPDAPRVPDGLRVYAFGDLHGREDLAIKLFELVSDDIQADRPDDILVIGLGDYIDRGPASCGVIDLLQNELSSAFPTVFLKGNHEAMMFDFLDRPSEIGSSWIRMGGLECMQSYGVRCDWRMSSPEEFTRMRDELAEEIYPRHGVFLSRLGVSQIVGDYFFVHAGARPGVPLTKQREQDLLWIRKGFADRDEPFEKMIVHGHTAGRDVFVGRNRINLDTGAYATGRLTCLALEGEGRRLMEVTA